MWTDVTDCYAFYETELGAVVQKTLAQTIVRAWPNVKGKVVAGFGYTHPYLPYFSLDAERVFSLMPAPMGVMGWPNSQNNASVLVSEQLPFANQSIDRLLIVHAFEHLADTERMVREFWRVLAAGGKLLVVVPNRRGLWSRSSHTPFGQGHPYTGRQLFSLVEQGHFTPKKPKYCLFHPPLEGALGTGLRESLEHVGERWFKKFAGLVVLEATKRVIEPLKGGQKAWQPLIFIPKPGVTCLLKEEPFDPI